MVMDVRNPTDFAISNSLTKDNVQIVIPASGHDDMAVGQNGVELRGF